VKEGSVTIYGDSDHQSEKDGVESVVRFVAGVKTVINNINVKPAPPMLGPMLDSAPVRLNPIEAKILDDAMQKQMQLSEQLANRESAAPASASVPREAREQAAARFREEDAASKRIAEERLRRDTEAFERRQEEMRRIEADRRSRAEQARLEASTLSSGTIAWSGVVDGAEDIIIAGSSASVRHLSGAPPRDVKASFSAPVPRSPAKLTLLSVSGRGLIKVVQEPQATNGYTTIIRVDDSEKGGAKPHQFTLRWILQ
jgi:BON domain